MFVDRDAHRGAEGRPRRARRRRRRLSRRRWRRSSPTRSPTAPRSSPASTASLDGAVGAARARRPLQHAARRAGASPTPGATAPSPTCWRRCSDLVDALGRQAHRLRRADRRVRRPARRRPRDDDRFKALRAAELVVVDRARSAARHARGAARALDGKRDGVPDAPRRSSPPSSPRPARRSRASLTAVAGAPAGHRVRRAAVRRDAVRRSRGHARRGPRRGLSSGHRARDRRRGAPPCRPQLDAHDAAASAAAPGRRRCRPPPRRCSATTSGSFPEFALVAGAGRRVGERGRRVAERHAARLT